jgi:tetratricopeptide (TPR) repeat protein
MGKWTTSLVLLAALTGIVLAQDRYHPDFDRGVREMKARNWQGALVIWEDILRTKAGHHEARNNYAVCLIRLKRYDEADKHLEYLLQATPDKAGVRLNSGVARQGKNDLPKAVEHTDRAVEMNRSRQPPSDHDLAAALYNRGWLLDEQGKHDEAITALRDAVQKRPDHGKAWLMLSIAYGEKRQYADARKALEEAGRWKDTDPDLSRLVTENRRILDAAEKSPPPITPPTGTPTTTTPTPPGPTTWTFWSNGWMRTCGLWDKNAWLCSFVYLVLHGLLLVGCNLLFRQIYGPPLLKKEAESAAVWTMLIAGVFFGLGFGFVGCGKWVLLVVVALVSGGIIGAAND